MGSRASRQKKEDKMVGEEFEVNVETKLPDVIPEEKKDFVQKACDVASHVDGDVNIVSIMVHCCVQSIVQDEVVKLTEQMMEYRNLLSRKMRETPEEDLDLQATFNLARLSESFKAGWLVYKQGGADKEDASFEAFMTTMDFTPPEVDTTQDEMDATQSNSS